MALRDVLGRADARRRRRQPDGDRADGSTITFLDAAVAEPDQPLEGTRWVVDGLLANEGISTVPIGAEASITITDGTAAVEAGCNTGSAGVEITDTTITFGPLTLTRMACGPRADRTRERGGRGAHRRGDLHDRLATRSKLRTTRRDAGEIGLNLTGRDVSRRPELR